MGAVLKRLNWAAGIAAFLLIAGMCIARHDPPLPRVLDLRVRFPVGQPNRTEPLIATGVFEDGDFFVVTYLSETTAVFAHDSWGVGGPRSQTFSLEPGALHTLRLEMPAVAEIVGVSSGKTAPLRVELDGHEILSADVPFHARAPKRLFFAENPVGGNTSGGIFRGELLTADGRRLIGDVESFWPRSARIGLWLTTSLWQVLCAALLGLGIAWVTPRILRWLGTTPREQLRGVGDRLSRHSWFLGLAAMSVVAFVWLITDETFRLRFPESFGNFYDYQARSLMQGRVDVPEAAIGGEAFIIDGKYYGYFGPTPALLRLPFAIFDIAFGELSRSFMTLYFAGSLVACYVLLLHATTLLRGGKARPSRWAVTLLVTSAGLGSTLFFLGSRAYIYHEAILCGAMWALWSAYFSLRWLSAPESRAWMYALACGVLSVQARPPSGLFALTMLGCTAVAIALAGRKFRLPFTVAALCVAGVLTFNGVSYLKFKTFDGAPLRYAVQYSTERLATFDGRSFHVSNLRHNVDRYVLLSWSHIDAHFPWFLAGDKPTRRYPEARMDLEEMSVAMPFAMPSLFALAVVGCAWGCWRASRVRWPLVILWIAAVPMALALFTAIATSHRYTGDFCPLLIAAAAFAVAVLDADTGRRRRAFLTGASVLTVASIAITLALSLQYQHDTVWGVPESARQNYQHFQQRVDRFFGVAAR